MIQTRNRINDKSLFLADPTWSGRAAPAKTKETNFCDIQRVDGLEQELVH